MNGRVRRISMAAALTVLALPAVAQAPRHVPRERGAVGPQAAPAGRLGFGADNDAQQGGVAGNAPFNNQLRKHTDPLGANGGK